VNLVLLPSLFPYIEGLAFVGLAWYAWRSRQRSLVATTWIGSSVAVGYFRYSLMCAAPLACDVGGVDYVAMLWPRFTVGAALAFGVAVVAVRFAKPDEALWPRTLALGSLATVGASFLFEIIVGVLWPW
jgi:hypothetical protein